MSLRIDWAANTPETRIPNSVAMEPPPAELDGARVVRWAPIPEEQQHANTDGVQENRKRPLAIAICAYPSDGGWYSFHCDQDWAVLYDGWHMSDDEARTAMEDRFPGMALAWRTDVLAHD